MILTITQELTGSSLSYPQVIIVDNHPIIMENMLEKYGNADQCPVRNVLDRFGDKWSMLVLLLLAECDTLRFNEIQRCIGTISQKMLATTLKSLENDGLVKRKLFPQVPPRVDYSLTGRGQSLIPHLKGLVKWADEHMKEIRKSRIKSEKVS
ncbi:MAG TPA: helix-turn-helix domain-containing protein [Saprospiraceae bacterium]|nr:helix-turn-helix domain-containing protein [Saprospiraceae bacterium]